MGASTRPLDPGVMDAPGLQPPRMHTGDRVTGTNKGRHHIENKRRRREREAAQIRQSYWSAHTGDKPHLGPALTPPDAWRNDMCPRGLALHHPAAKTLLSYATQGCPVHTGQPWKLEWIEEAIRRGPHVSALVPEAIKQHRLEVEEKVRKGQAKVVDWEHLKGQGIPAQLKVSPLAMIPHKSKQFRAILDLSFGVKLKSGERVPSVNDSTTLQAPTGAIDHEALE